MCVGSSVNIISNFNVLLGLSLHLEHEAGGPMLDTEHAAKISTPEDDKAQSVPNGALSFPFLKEGKSSVNWDEDAEEEDDPVLTIKLKKQNFKVGYEVPKDRSVILEKSDGLEAKVKPRGGKYTCLTCEPPDCRPLPPCVGAMQVIT